MNDATRCLGKALCVALAADEWCTAPGGFFVKGHGFVASSKARKIAGVAPVPRAPKALATTGRGGDWNAFVGLVLAVSKGSDR